jgi:hypothetical protein
MTTSADQIYALTGAAERPHFLTPQLAGRLETALCSVGAYGEVRLVVFKGRVRFIEIMRSECVGQRSGPKESDE